MKKLVLVVGLLIFVGVGCESANQAVQQNDDRGRVAALEARVEALQKQNDELLTSNEPTTVSTNTLSRIETPQLLKDEYEKLKKGFPGTIAEFGCLPTAKFECDGLSCLAHEPDVFFFLDLGTEKGTYFRCDLAGCDSHEIRVAQSGGFTVVTPTDPLKSFLFKLGLANTFEDVATLGVSAYNSGGFCEPL